MTTASSIFRLGFVRLLPYIVLGVLSILLQKYVVNTPPIAYPLGLLFLTSLFTLLFAIGWFCLRRDHLRIDPSSFVHRPYPFFGLLAVLDRGLSFVSLGFISVTLYHVFKSLSPVFILVFSFVAKLETPSVLLVSSIASIVFGVLVATVGKSLLYSSGDSRSLDVFNAEGANVYLLLLGLGLVVVSSIAQGFRFVYSQSLMVGRISDQSDATPQVESDTPSQEDPEDPEDLGNQKSDRIGVLDLNLYSSATSAVLALIACFVIEVLPRLVFSIGKRPTMPTLLQFGMFVIAAIVGASVSFVTLLLVQATSAVTLTVTAQLRAVLLVASATIIFKDSWDVLMIVGWILTTVGVVLYNAEKARVCCKVSTSEDT